MMSAPAETMDDLKTSVGSLVNREKVGTADGTVGVKDDGNVRECPFCSEWMRLKTIFRQSTRFEFAAYIVPLDQ